MDVNGDGDLDLEEFNQVIKYQLYMSITWHVYTSATWEAHVKKNQNYPFYTVYNT